MTRKEYLELTKKVDSGEVDYNSLSREVRAECRQHRLDIIREETIRNAKILEQCHLPTGMEQMTRDTSRPAYEAASRTKIIYDKKNKSAKRVAKQIKKKREKAIEISGKEFMKKQKGLKKKAKKRAKKLRKKIKKKEWKKLLKKACKIAKHLTEEEQEKYLKYAEEHSPVEMIQKIVSDAKQKDKEDRAFAIMWGSWVNFRELDETDPDDIQLLEEALENYDELTPYEKYRRREIRAGRPDPEKFCGDFLKPRVPIDASDEEYYMTRVMIKRKDWKDYKKFLSGKKIKSCADIIKYRRKFNQNCLEELDKTDYSKKKKGDSFSRYMYVPMTCRDVNETLKEYERVSKSGKRMKGVVREFADFIREHNTNLPQHVYDNLERYIEKQDKSIDKMVKEAETALKQCDYMSMHDVGSDMNLKPQDLDCSMPKDIQKLFS